MVLGLASSECHDCLYRTGDCLGPVVLNSIFLRDILSPIAGLFSVVPLLEIISL